ncbi:hypothetical protein ABT075_05455 [Streptomyces sp. NPDC002677]|uniref:hypothetical protein n=1 Tax=Streptomyces sp. NPDC002677 TaxID=3154774 RepID=UPI00331D288D
MVVAGGDAVAGFVADVDAATGEDDEEGFGEAVGDTFGAQGLGRLGLEDSCRVVPGNPGTFFVDFQLAPEPGAQASA